LQALGADDCRPVAGGVAFAGDRALAYRANLWSRLASRILREIGTRRYRGPEDLYKLAAGVTWEQYFDARHTLRVDTSATRSPLRSLNFATLRVKDAIVDRLRERTGQRPSIDTRTPDARVWLFVEMQQATLYLDLSGEPLFKRGWRSGRDDGGEAPLKENLAAGLLTLAGWTPDQTLVDPFCGSGTLAIEAACLGCDIAPGLTRGFGFEKLLDHDPALWAGLRSAAVQRAQAGMADQQLRIVATDIDAAAIARARRNQSRAGLPEAAIAWQQADATRLRPPFDTPGLMIANPPYGERLGAHTFSGDTHTASGDTHAATMRAVGATLKAHWAGWQVWLLSADPELPRQLAMKENRRTPLFNGALECRFFSFRVFAAAASGEPSGTPSRPGRPSPR